MPAYPSLYQLLKKYNIRPQKGLGQHFLADENHLRKLLEAAELSPLDTVLEIGPGLGTLSVPLSAAVNWVVAVEVDALMVNILKREMAAFENFQVVRANILDIDPAEILAAHRPHFVPGDRYHVVANLPYYITSAIIQHLLEAPHPPQRLVLTLQREVAQRIIAKPGDMSLLAVSVQFYGRPKLCHVIPANAFLPPPKVASAVLRIDRYQEPPITAVEPVSFFRVVKAGFSQKRKQLKNALSAGLGRPQAEIVARLETAGIDPTRRAETLSLAEWGTLAEIIYSE